GVLRHCRQSRWAGSLWDWLFLLAVDREHLHRPATHLRLLRVVGLDALGRVGIRLCSGLGLGRELGLLVRLSLCTILGTVLRLVSRRLLQWLRRPDRLGAGWMGCDDWQHVFALGQLVGELAWRSGL